jgi:hypothetical protein
VRSLRTRRIVVAGVIVTATIVLVAWSLVESGRLAWDTTTNLAAGERLNAHHDLYRLGPGDRWIWINPPYWSVPLLYPPTIAVVWMPLAALPGELGLVLWEAADAAALLAAVCWIVINGGRGTAVAGLLLVPAFAWEIHVGNIHGFLLAALVLVHTRPRLGAMAVGVLTAIKLTPATVILWMFVTGRTRLASLATIVAVAAILIAAVAVGPSALGDYVNAVRAAEPSVISIPGVAAAGGLPQPRLIGWALTAFLLLEVVALRKSRLAWVVAVVAMVIGSPVVNMPTLSLLLAAFIVPRSYGTDDAVIAETPSTLTSGAPGEMSV